MKLQCFDQRDQRCFRSYCIRSRTKTAEQDTHNGSAHTRVNHSAEMAPFGTTSTAILATTTAIICLAVVAPPVVSSGKSFDRPHRRHYDPQRQSCSTKTPTNRARPVVAWGHRRSRGTTDRIQQQHTDNDGRGFTSYDGDDIDAGSDGGGWMDPSWTHAAFRAFHELRAGRPQQTYVEDVSEDVTRGAEDGPGRRLQRQLSSLMQARWVYIGRVYCLAGVGRGAGWNIGHEVQSLQDGSKSGTVHSKSTLV